MTDLEILEEIVTIRRRMLDRCLTLQETCPGAISDESVDEKRLDLLEAQLRLSTLTPSVVERK